MARFWEAETPETALKSFSADQSLGSDGRIAEIWMGAIVMLYVGGDNQVKTEGGLSSFIILLSPRISSCWPVRNSKPFARKCPMALC
jgi:hypothetical protein